MPHDPSSEPTDTAKVAAASESFFSSVDPADTVIGAAPAPPSVFPGSSEPLSFSATSAFSSYRCQPLYHRLLVRVLPGEEQKTSGGIYLAQSEGSPLWRATVLAVGQGRLLLSGAVVPLAVKEGDVVLLLRGEGLEYNALEGLRLVDEDRVFAVLQSRE